MDIFARTFMTATLLDRDPVPPARRRRDGWLLRLVRRGR